MNKNQNIAALIYIATLLGIFIYLPFYVHFRETESIAYTGYEFIFKMSSAALPNVPMLIFEFLIVTMIAGVSYFMLKDTGE